jgi:hypothetical protein
MIWSFLMATDAASRSSKWKIDPTRGKHFMNFAEKLKTLRKEKNISQEQLAQKLLCCGARHQFKWRELQAVRIFRTNTSFTWS